jgi:ABC-type glycerol-3-phosphate transport system substrate-binding protein
VPIRKSIVTLPAFQEYLKIAPSALVASEQLKVAGEQMTIHDVDRIGLILVAAVQAAQSGRLTAQAALDQAQSRSMAILAAYK